MNRQPPALRYKTSHLVTGPVLNPASFFRLFMSRPEGCKQTGRLRKSEFAQLRKYISCSRKSSTARVKEYSTRMQTRSVAAASVRGRVDPQLRLLSANAEHLVPRVRPGPLDHEQRSRVERTPTLMSRPEILWLSRKFLHSCFLDVITERVCRGF